MKTKFISILALSTLVIAGCNNKLDIQQHGVLDFNTYYSTDEEAETAINAVYLQLRGNETNVYMGKNSPADDAWAGGSGRNDNSQIEQLNEFSFDTNQEFIQGMFEGYYGIIYKCNVVISHCTQDTPVMKRAVAEAKVLRAMQYFDLITLWGNPPLVDHELEPEEYSRPNGSTEELWALVNNDLTEAIESGLLSQKKNAGDKVWRVTKQYAQALLGKAYLWQKDYEKSAKYLNEVVDSKLYELYPIYEDIYRYDNKLSSESLFESVRIVNPSNGFENFEFTHAYLAWRLDKLNLTDEAYQQFNCGQAYGFLTPKKALYDAFVAEEGVNGYRLNSTMKTVEQMAALGVTVKEPQINEGFYNWKRRVLAASIDGSSFGFSCENDPVWMRYAEVLLLAAEANLLNNNQGKANECLNEVRHRAKLADKVCTLEAIQIEKRLELCYDSCRYQDLLRWGLAEQYLKDQGGIYPMLLPNGNITYGDLYDKDHSKYGWKKGKHERFPYPGLEIRLNKNIDQNDGWK